MYTTTTTTTTTTPTATLLIAYGKECTYKIKSLSLITTYISKEYGVKFK
jgi:hypothetical protein